MPVLASARAVRFTEIDEDEPRLPREIGLASVDVIAGAEADAGPGRRADGARGDDLGNLQLRQLEAEVLVDGEEGAAVAAHGSEDRPRRERAKGVAQQDRSEVGGLCGGRLEADAKARDRAG